MAIRLLLVATLAAACSGLAPRPAPGHQAFNRRAICSGAAFALLAPAAALAAEEPSSVFVGRYTDPNNHPGGYREITLLPGGIGAYRLANVHGGKGRGEPDSYDLPAIIIERGEQKQIIIDFAVPPKNGPRDFAGVWDAKEKGIRFVRDGNLWPQQQ